MALRARGSVDVELLLLLFWSCLFCINDLCFLEGYLVSTWKLLSRESRLLAEGVPVRWSVRHVFLKIREGKCAGD